MINAIRTPFLWTAVLVLSFMELTSTLITNIYFSSLGLVTMGLVAAYVTVSKGDCHYRRETIMGVSAYLVFAGVFRIVSTMAGMDHELSRSITGILALMLTLGALTTSINHWLFHRILTQKGVIADPR